MHLLDRWLNVFGFTFVLLALGTLSVTLPPIPPSNDTDISSPALDTGSSPTNATTPSNAESFEDLVASALRMIAKTHPYQVLWQITAMPPEGQGGKVSTDFSTVLVTIQDYGTKVRWSTDNSRNPGQPVWIKVKERGVPTAVETSKWEIWGWKSFTANPHISLREACRLLILNGYAQTEFALFDLLHFRTDPFEGGGGKVRGEVMYVFVERRDTSICVYVGVTSRRVIRNMCPSLTGPVSVSVSEGVGVGAGSGDGAISKPIQSSAATY